MRSLHKLMHKRKFRTNALIATLLFVVIGFAGYQDRSHKAFSSVEVQFTDASHSGLAIVPASCPSNPGDADAPYGCTSWGPACPDGSPVPGDVTKCTCAQGNVSACARCADGSLAPGNNAAACTCAQGNQAACVRCADGSLAPNNNASQCTCLQGNISACTTKCPDGSSAPNGNPTQCTCSQGNVNMCGGSSCPVGYRLTTAGTCIFDSCPAGYTLQGSSCVSICPAGQHSVGSLCVCDATNLTPDANGQCTKQVCPSGYQFDPGTGKCIAINACNLAPTCSDVTHALNRCTGAVTNCALNGAGWICLNGSCQKSPAPIASISASPSLLSPGYATTVSWTSQNTTDCRVSGNNGDGIWTGTSGSHKSSPIQSQTTFTLVCDGYDGSVIKQTTVANIVPVFIEK